MKNRACRRHSIFLLIFILLTICSASNATAESNVSFNSTQVHSLLPRFINVDSDTTRYFATAKSDFYLGEVDIDDETHLLNTLRTLEWTPNHQVAYAPKKVLKDIWARFVIQTGEINDSEWLLQQGNPHFEYMDIYVFRAGKLVQQNSSGTAYPYEDLTVKGHYPIVPIELHSHEELEVYLRFQSKSVIFIELKLYLKDQFQYWDKQFNLFQGLYFGGSLVMLVISLAIFIALREISFLSYAVFLSSFMVWYFLNIGFGHPYLPEFLREHLVNLSEAASCLTCATGFLFITTFLDLKPKAPRLYKTMQALMVFSLICAGLSFTPPSELRLMLMVFCGLLSYLFIFIVSVYLWRSGSIYATFFVMAWIGLCGSIIYTCVSIFANLPMPADIILLMETSSMAEFICLSCALAVRLKEINWERNKAAMESEAKSDFLAKMSHEIRTPMNGVIGMSQLLQDHLNNDTARQYNRMIQSSGESLLTIINDILDFSKIEAGKMSVESIPMDFHTLVNDTVKIFMLQAQEKGLHLHCELDPSTPKFIKSDPVRIKQIIINLLGNALKFTLQGEVAVTTTVTEANKLQISVRDTGVGISKDAQANLFAEFSQEDDTTTRVFGGTGLGLSICLQLAKLMGGEMGLDSEKGKGSTFWVCFAYESTDQEEIKSLSNVEPQGEVVENRFSDLRVLVAEDNNVNKMVIAGMLNKLGVNYHCVENGKEALEYYRNHIDDLDLVLMDCEMPVMDGFESTRNIRLFEQEKGLEECPIYALTAHAVGTHIDKCYRIGMNHHISKPVDFKALKDSLYMAMTTKEEADRQANSG